MSKDNKVDVNELRNSHALQPVSYGEMMVKNAVAVGITVPLVGLGISHLLGNPKAYARREFVNDLALWPVIGAVMGYGEARAANHKIQEIKHELDKKSAASKDCGCGR